MSREESKVAGFFVFSHIRLWVILDWVRLGYPRVKESPTESFPQKLEIQEKLNCENTKNPATLDSSLDLIRLFELRKNGFSNDTEICQ